MSSVIESDLNPSPPTLLPNFTLCSNTSVSDSGTSGCGPVLNLDDAIEDESLDAVIYVIVVLAVYTSAMVILLVKYLKREMRDAYLNHYIMDYLEPEGGSGVQTENQARLQDTEHMLKKKYGSQWIQCYSLCRKSESVYVDSVQQERRPRKQPCTQPHTQPCTQPHTQPCTQPHRQPHKQSCTQPDTQPHRPPNKRPCTQPHRPPYREPYGQSDRRPQRHPSILDSCQSLPTFPAPPSHCLIQMEHSSHTQYDEKLSLDKGMTEIPSTNNRENMPKTRDKQRVRSVGLSVSDSNLHMHDVQMIHPGNERQIHCGNDRQMHCGKDDQVPDGTVGILAVSFAGEKTQTEHRRERKDSGFYSRSQSTYSVCSVENGHVVVPP